ncbi:glycosyl hydrolase [Zavarzinia sp.]|uniref:glycosyl hydrolase n=1 Tax=Zavarzinia sp. TaxID=2027920 RepID=UPI003564A4AC
MLPLILALLFPPAVDAAPAPANPRANAKTRAVLDFIGSLETRPDKHLLSGQFTNFGTLVSLELPEKIHQQTGHWPALIGVDYADFYDSTTAQRSNLAPRLPNQVAIAYWRAGGLVTVSAHLYNPANPDGGGLRDHGVDLAEVFMPGTATHQRWMQELDELAAGLQELREAGVVVLWRPFHEMNGRWFWWGKQDPAVFIRVWRYMFAYFSRIKGLDNLLWVYAPNHGTNAADYYPGDAYVDMVGLDAYTDFVDQSHIKGYAEMARLPKPFGFTEYGPHGARNPPGDYDYRRFIPDLKANFPRTTFFMVWNEKWSPANNPHARELYNDPWMVNREDLPPGLAGSAP